ncbi:unnamed protein product [Fusarium venenatum]|uniref:Uncharacterized protein n=1 Tax=Fusarium venenatum TaxID=56646 RepID=A0A2L2SSM0_9HYPO|nr:uncharacterized protein FVRRES_04600 [Fusarium venenatum]CEI60164.1 unnamed protein product [Fusarium venenatum]
MPGRNNIKLATREARRYSLYISLIASLFHFQDLEYCSHVPDELICSI